MALTKCRECGGQVSTEATACPHCGAPVRPLSPAQGAPRSAKRPRRTWPIIVATVVLLALWISHESSRRSPPANSEPTAAAASSPAAAPASQPAAPVVVAASCKSDYHLCRDNSDLVNNFDGIIAAQVACKEATDEHVQYGSPDWPWFIYFSSFFPGHNYAKHGIVDLIDDRVKIQNRYGAMARSRVVCEYDLQAKKVTMLLINGQMLILEPKLYEDWITASGAAAASAPSSASSGPMESALAPSATAASAGRQQESGVEAQAESAAVPAASEPIARGPSFDCARAFYPDEKAICASPTLSALDRQTAKLFEKAADASGNPEAFRKGNVKYVIERRTCGSSVACITAWYQRRQAALRKDLAGMGQ